MSDKQNTDQLVVDEGGQYAFFPPSDGTRKSGPIGPTEADRVIATIRSGQIELDIHQKKEDSWEISKDYLSFRVQEELVAIDPDSSDIPVFKEEESSFL
jgi:hypothetical protein